MNGQELDNDSRDTTRFLYKYFTFCGQPEIKRYKETNTGRGQLWSELK
jgi:hypothetical protein